MQFVIKTLSGKNNFCLRIKYFHACLFDIWVLCSSKGNTGSFPYNFFFHFLSVIKFPSLYHFIPNNVWYLFNILFFEL